MPFIRTETGLEPTKPLKSTQNPMKMPLSSLRMPHHRKAPDKSMKTNWISVKDRMPTRSDVVIGYSPELSEGVCYHFLEFENGTWKYFHDDGMVDIEITHWMKPESLGTP